jgi:hypothetical protein
MARPATSLLVLTLGLLLAACAAPTPYQPADGGFGYSDQQLESNRYRVTFAGNSVTPRDVVQNYLLHRAAELTLEKGYDYFTVVRQDLERSTAYQGSGFTNAPVFFDSHRAIGWGIGTTSYTAYPIDSYAAFADIVLHKGEKPEDDPNAYDARDVLRQLGPTVVHAPVQ